MVLAVGTIFLISCQSASSRAQETKTQITKMTRPKVDESKSPRLGIRVTMDAGPTQSEIEAVNRSFERQMGEFEVCLAEGGKVALIRIKAHFRINPTGALEVLRVDEVMPDKAPLKSCFLKQIKRLEFSRRKKGVSGELILATYFGDSGVPEGGIRSFK